MLRKHQARNHKTDRSRWPGGILLSLSQWKKQLLDGASELFTRGKKSKDKEEGQAKEAELFQQIGKLQMELEWLKKKSQLL